MKMTKKYRLNALEEAANKVRERDTEVLNALYEASEVVTDDNEWYRALKAVEIAESRLEFAKSVLMQIAITHEMALGV